MLHELLLALAGLDGAVFIPHGDTLRTSAYFPHLHDAERDLLNRIIILGPLYKQIEQFAWSTPSYGAYMAATRRVMQQCIKTYQATLIHLERSAVRTSTLTTVHTLPISFIHAQLSDYYLLLPELSVLVQEIDHQQLVGVDLMRVVHDRLRRTGIAQVRDAYQAILDAQLDVLRRFIVMWCCYGRLSDAFGEFFITVSESTKVDVGKVPFFMSQETAQDCLYVGNTLIALRTATGGQEDVDALKLSLASSEYFGAMAKHTLLTREADGLQVLLRRARSCAAGHLWFCAAKKYHARELMHVFRSVFLLGQGLLFDALFGMLERRIARSRDTKHAKAEFLELSALWKKCINNTDLYPLSAHHAEWTPEELEAWNAYLGDFTLVDGGDTWMQDPHIGFGYPVALSFKLAWPFNLVVSEQDIHTYSNAFQLLFAVRRTLWWLQQRPTRHLMELVVDGEYEEDEHALMVKSTRRLWELKRRMLVFVEVLWAHFEMNVVASCYASYDAIFTRIRSKQDDMVGFETLQHAHHHFLENLQLGCFLHPDDAATNQAIRTSLRALLTECVVFTQWVHSFSSFSATWPWSMILDFSERIDQHSAVFQSHADKLFQQLANITDTALDPKLAAIRMRYTDQLLLSLDYNQWYSTSH
jgi:hypothetical protein